MDFLRATAVTQGWSEYRNYSQHRKLALEKTFSCRFCGNTNLRPFDHRSDALAIELSPLHSDCCHVNVQRTLTGGGLMDISREKEIGEGGGRLIFRMT